MGYRNQPVGSAEFVLVDGQGEELATFEVAAEGTLQVDLGEGLTDVTTDDEPEGVHVLMLVPNEEN